MALSRAQQKARGANENTRYRDLRSGKAGAIPQTSHPTAPTWLRRLCGTQKEVAHNPRLIGASEEQQSCLLFRLAWLDCPGHHNKWPRGFSTQGCYHQGIDAFKLRLPIVLF